MTNPLAATVKLPLPEQVIAGRYKLLRSLGQGGMGLVFLAEQLGVGNQVAVKFLDPEPTADDTRVARFLREARVGLEVKHPGAAQVLDLGRDESLRLFLVFEYVEGVDLRALLKEEGRLSFDEARSIALKVAEVLAFAHERGIVHRDIKPENIRVRRDLAGAHVKVLDFGIARLMKDSGVRLTAEGSLAGTPRYMAPEQVRDGPVDARTDGYALGLVLYEMLTGAAAFAGKNISQVLLKQLQEPLPSLAEVDPQLRFPEVDAFLARACAKEPAARFQTMADFVRALLALEVNARAWPAPRLPAAPARDGDAPTRDEQGQSVSDTLLRDDMKTETATPAPSVDPRRAEEERPRPVPPTHETWRVESALEAGRSGPVAPPSVEPGAARGDAASAEANERRGAVPPASSPPAVEGTSSSQRDRDARPASAPRDAAPLENRPPARPASSAAAGSARAEGRHDSAPGRAKDDVRSSPTRLSRAHGDLGATVRGGADAPAPARRPSRWPYVVFPLLVAAALAAWWLRQHG